MDFGSGETRDEVARRNFLDRAWLSVIGDGIEMAGLSDDIAQEREVVRLGSSSTRRACYRTPQ